MRRLGRSGRVSLIFAACVAVLALTGAGSAAGKPTPKPKLVSVADFFFSPTTVTLKPGGKVKWVWASTNTSPHDVHLKQGPKALKQKGTYSTKTTAVTEASFTKQFTTPGTYKYICTIHPTEMKMTVVVKK